MPSSSGATLQMGTANGKALDGGTTIATSKAFGTRKATGFDISSGSTITLSRADQKPAHRDPPGFLFAQDSVLTDIKATATTSRLTLDGELQFELLRDDRSDSCL